VVKKWAPNPQKEALWSCEFHAGKGWLTAANIADSITLSMSKDKQYDTIIEGEFGRRFEVEENVDFLLDVVMKSPGAQTWLQNKLSSSWYMRFFNRRRGQSTHTPKIWVCTGIQLVGGAHARTKSENAREFTWGAKLNSGMITSGIPGGPDIIDLKTSYTKESGVETGYYHDDERIWAALFFPLDVEYIKPGATVLDPPADKEKPAKEHHHKVPIVIGLEELEDLGSSAIRDNETRSDEKDGITLDNDDDGIREAHIKGLSIPGEPAVHLTNSEYADKASKQRTFLIDTTHYREEMDKISKQDCQEYSKYGNWFDSRNDYHNSQ